MESEADWLLENPLTKFMKENNWSSYIITRMINSHRVKHEKYKQTQPFTMQMVRAFQRGNVSASLTDKEGYVVCQPGDFYLLCSVTNLRPGLFSEWYKARPNQKDPLHGSTKFWLMGNPFAGLRHLHNMTQKVMSKRAGLKVSVIRAYEHGKGENISQVEHFATCFGVPGDDLLLAYYYWLKERPLAVDSKIKITSPDTAFIPKVRPVIRWVPGEYPMRKVKKKDA